MSKLLMNEVPLMVQPSLAKKVGLNEALFLQQLHYWLERSTKVINERRWIYNSVGAWQKQFSFWSVSTIKRIIASLEKRKLIISGNFNSFSMDRTKWYTIDYDELDKLEDEKNITPNDNNNPDNSDNSGNNNNQDENSEKSGDIANGSSCTDGENKGFKADSVNEEENSEKELNDKNDDMSKVSGCTNGENHVDTANSSSCHHGKCQDEISNTRDYNRDYSHKNTHKNTTTTDTEKENAEDENVVVDIKTMKKKIVLLAIKCGIQAKNMRVFFNSYNLKDIEKQLKLLENAIKSNVKIKNPAGWLRSALNNNYSDTAADYSAITAEKKKVDAKKAKQRNDVQLQALQGLL